MTSITAAASMLLSVMAPAAEAAVTTLRELGVEAEVKVLSAHRTPDRLVAYAKSAKGRGLKVIIAGAGGAACTTGATACMVPRAEGVLLMRIFIPLSDEISIESTEDSSSISTSFFTYLRSII